MLLSHFLFNIFQYSNFLPRFPIFILTNIFSKTCKSRCFFPKNVSINLFFFHILVKIPQRFILYVHFTNIIFLQYHILKLYKCQSSFLMVYDSILYSTPITKKLFSNNSCMFFSPQLPKNFYQFRTKWACLLLTPSGMKCYNLL